MQRLRSGFLARAPRGRAVPSLVLFGLASISSLAAAQVAPVPLSSTPAPADQSVRAGEIALTGAVQTAGGPNNSFSIAAVSYTVPGGRTRPIAPAKLKIVLPTAGCNFVGEGAEALKVGIRVRVIGPDEGTGQPLEARLVIFVDAPKPVAAPAPPIVSPASPPNSTVASTQPAAVSAPPATAADNGYSLTVTSAGFDATNSFVASFRLTGPGGKNEDLARWFAQPQGPGLTVRVSSPSGQFVPAQTYPTSVWAPLVDPRWPSVTLDCYGLDPGASGSPGGVEANGTRQETAVLDFKRPGEKPESLSETTTTTAGAVVTLDRAELESAAGKSALKLDFHWSAPETTPDLDIAPGLPRLVDNEGKLLDAAVTGFSMGNRGFYNFQFGTLPSVANWRLTLPLDERLASLSTTTGRFHIRLSLPRSTAAPDHPVPAYGSFKSARADGLEVRLNPPATPLPGFWTARAVLLNLTHDPAINWTVTGVTASDQMGHPIPGASALYLQDAYFRASGTPVDSSEKAARLMVPISPVTPTKSLNLKLGAEGRRSWHGYFSIEAPIPATDAQVTPSLPVSTESGLKFTLEAEKHYSSLAGLPGLGRATWIAQRGLALHFAGSLPLTGTPVFSVAGARDDLGRPLQSRTTLWLPGNALAKGDTSGWTLFLPEPAPDAKTAVVDTELNILCPVTYHANVTFDNVPVPAGPVH